MNFFLYGKKNLFQHINYGVIDQISFPLFIEEEVLFDEKTCPGLIIMISFVSENQKYAT